MSNNDYFTVAYKILSYLKHCYENGEEADPNFLSAVTFEISHIQFIKTLQMLKDDNYITGIILTPTTTGTIISGLRSTDITSSGLEYLADNSMMKKAYNILKEFRDWAPLI